MSFQQQTLKQAVSCNGVGVHTGVRAALHILPAPVDHGICFYRTDLGKGMHRPINADARFVTGLTLGTTLANAEGDSISTVEHLMAACLGLGLDNLRIEVDGPEVPIMDGSASIFCELFKHAGIAAQNRPRKWLKILKPVQVEHENRWVKLLPSDHFGLSLSARIDFDSPVIGTQNAALNLTPETFSKDIAFARTFGFYNEVDTLQKMGFARGGSLDNAIIIHEGKVINPEGLRCQDEFIRHKLLDAVGDLALAGGHIIGQYEAHRPGHALNNALVRKLLGTPAAWQWLEDVSLEDQMTSIIAA